VFFSLRRHRRRGKRKTFSTKIDSRVRAKIFTIPLNIRRVCVCVLLAFFARARANNRSDVLSSVAFVVAKYIYIYTSARKYNGRTRLCTRDNREKPIWRFGRSPTVSSRSSCARRRFQAEFRSTARVSLVRIRWTNTYAERPLRLTSRARTSSDIRVSFPIDRRNVAFLAFVTVFSARVRTASPDGSARTRPRFGGTIVRGRPKNRHEITRDAAQNSRPAPLSPRALLAAAPIAQRMCCTRPVQKPPFGNFCAGGRRTGALGGDKRRPRNP